MQTIARVLVGVVGLLALLLALRIWIAPEEVAAQLGIQAAGPLGIATIRADMAGFFAAGGGLSLFAAIRNRAGLLTAPMTLIGLALSGRIITVVMNGVSNDMIPPMAIEAVLLAVLAFGRMRLAR